MPILQVRTYSPRPVSSCVSLPRPCQPGVSSLSTCIRVGLTVTATWWLLLMPPMWVHRISGQQILQSKPSDFKCYMDTTKE